MFDDLHDPNPPSADTRHLAAVARRARQLRLRRWAVVTTAALVAVGAGVGAIVARGSDGRGIESADLPGTVSSPTQSTTTDLGSRSPTTAPSTPTAPTTTASAPANPAPVECPGLPDGLALTTVADGEAWSVTNAGGEQLYAPEAPVIGVSRVLRGADGTLWVAEGEGTMTRIRRVTPNGQVHDSETVSSDGDGALLLSHVGTIDGRTAAAYIDTYNSQGGEQYGDIWLEYSDGERASLGTAGDPTSVAMSAAPNDAAIAVGATADLAEAFRYLTPDGDELDEWYDPSEDSTRYNMPPWFESPIVAPDGGRLAWVEGPDHRGDQPDRLVGSWELVVASPDGADEMLRVQVGATSETLIAADYDGRYWVGTFGERPGRRVGPVAVDPTRLVIVDTQRQDPDPVDAGCTPSAAAMIDRVGSQGGATTAANMGAS